MINAKVGSTKGAKSFSSGKNKQTTVPTQGRTMGQAPSNDSRVRPAKAAGVEAQGNNKPG